MGFNLTDTPLTASFVLATRKLFGEDVKVLYVKEAGYERGEPSSGEYVQVEVEQRKK